MQHAGVHDDDDDPETFACYRHPGRTTALRCIECERPICVDCAVQGPVGFKCPDCARTSRAARGVVPVHRMARGVVAGIVVAFVLGTLLYFVNIPFLGLVLAYFAGAAVGTVTRRASGGYRDPHLARVAAGAAAAGFLAVPLLTLLAADSPSGVAQFLVWRVLAAGVAAYGAYSRAA